VTIVDALRAALLLLVEGHSIPTMKAMSIPPQSASDVQPRVDRSVVTFDDKLAEPGLRDYWQAQSPAARLRAMETLRRINYGPGTTRRLQRVLEFARR